MFEKNVMSLNKEDVDTLLDKYEGRYLKKEMAFYQKNLDTLLDKYERRHIVITGDTVIGDFDSDGAALSAAMAAKLEPGTFMIRIVRRNEPVQRFANVYV